MRINKILDRTRRDIYCLYECEHCGYTEKGSGYDDDNYHNNVVPKLKCKDCLRNSEGIGPKFTPKYGDHVVI